MVILLKKPHYIIVNILPIILEIVNILAYRTSRWTRHGLPRGLNKKCFVVCAYGVGKSGKATTQYDYLYTLADGVPVYYQRIAYFKYICIITAAHGSDIDVLAFCIRQYVIFEFCQRSLSVSSYSICLEEG